jgi:adenylate cyclase
MSAWRLSPRRLRAWASAGVTLLVTALLCAALLKGRPPELLQRIDLWLQDAWTRSTLSQNSARPQVTVLALDEASLELLGQWPWPRDQVARVVDKVFEKGARALALDIVFAEADRNDAELIRRYLPSESQTPALMRALDRDGRMAQSLRERPVVLGYYFNDDPKRRTGALPEPWLPAEMMADQGLRWPMGAGYGANLPALIDAASNRAGHFNPHVDLDGVTRRIPMVIEHEGMLYPSLTLSVLTLLAGPQAVIDFGKAQTVDGRAVTDTLTLGDIRLPIDESARVLVPFFGGRGSLPQVSVADLINDRARAEDFQGRVVVFGPTAPGLKDNRATPVDRNQPGVELHASLLQGALTGQLPSRPPTTDAAVLSLLALTGLGMALGARGFRPMRFLVVSTVLGLGAVTLQGLLWWQHRFVLPVALPLLQVALLFTLLGSMGYILETRGRNAMNQLFGQYVPPELVGEMNEDPSRYSMSAKAADLTVMFADVRGFTTLSEKMTPTDLGDLMNVLLTELSRVIRADHLGTIDKYIGDCVMAFWGAPVPRADHAREAVAAALDMQTALNALRPKLVLPEGASIDVGIGLNTGPAVVGNMGSAYRMAYTVLGDTVNTASRLEGLTKAYGAHIVVGESVRAACLDDFLWCELDAVRVKGRTTPLAIFEPWCRITQATDAQRDQIHRHEQALMAYRARCFDDALSLWLGLQDQAPHPLWAMWIERAERYIVDPPAADWDGVYTFQTK